MSTVEEGLGSSEQPVEEGCTKNADGVLGKSVKVSILQQLQSFRYNKSTSVGTSLQGKDKIVNPSVTQSAISKNQIFTKDEGTEQPKKCKRVGNFSIESEFLVPDDSPEPDTKEPVVELCPNADKPSEDGMQDLETEKMEVDKSVPDCPSNDFRTEEVQPSTRANVIRPINRTVVHQICSGQVIVTLSTAVKELVENSLDAGATKIDIRLVEYGSKLVEVSDNATGIEETNFEGLALKHHTSKIAEFEDLGNLSTFGFRGEALSSLCALANLTVITRHKDSEQRSGHKIEYDYRGHITSKIRCARDFGTTVVLKDLFHTLPVRHKEFTKNLKKEFHRMVNVLYGYCLVVDGVRITCTNQVGNTAPQKVLSVPAYDTIKERVVALFGSKQLSSLLEIKQSHEVPEDILTEFGLTESTFEKKYEIEGYISKPNQGRSSNDRQFYFINSRPCDPAKISRIINEVYHTFSRQQNPFVCLHIKTNRENVDVNVTPDKRTLYVQNEKILLATIKASLVPILTTSASSFNPVNTSLSQPTLTFTGNSQQQQQQDVECVSPLTSLCLSSTFEIQPDPGNKTGVSLDESVGGFDEQYSTTVGRLPKSIVAKTNSFIKGLSRGYGGKTCSSSYIPSYSNSSAGAKRYRENEYSERTEESKQPKLSGFLQKFDIRKQQSVLGRKEQETEHSNMSEGDSDDNEITDTSNDNNTTIDDSDDVDVLYDDEVDEDEDLLSQRKSVTVSVCWQNILSKPVESKENASDSKICYVRKFRAKISPEDNSVAEEELKKQLTKDMFGQMQIIGQFNLGFIIVKNGPDLFIVDQHASDEKYNYEDLEKSTILNGQSLISPLDLELPAVSENIIIDNIEVFQKNGFDFIILPDEEPRKRVKMLKIPFSKNTEFGKSDVEELIFMLEDASSGKSFYRPTKVRQMFASRACRKSVMIGTTLNQKEMRVIVNHMGEMEQPWNCPHGRPTIRHLINLNLLPDLEFTKFNH